MPTSSNLATRSDKPATMRGGSSFTLVDNARAAAGPVRNPESVLSLQDIHFVEPVGEPSSFDPERRHAMIQDKMLTWRQIFLDGLTRQTCLARDPEFRYPRQRPVNRDGIQGREIIYVAPKPWWFERDGAVYLRLNFGERDWHVKGKNPVIRIGAAEELLPTLEKLHILTGTGEFDEIIEKMVIVSQR